MIPSGLIGIIGLIVGSFLNVCIYRIPRKESLVWPGSHCPACNTSIKAYELVPVLSWLALRGKCRTCGEIISARYPAVEILTGVAFYWSAEAAAGSVLDFLTAAIFMCTMIVVFFIDLDHYIIPDRIVFPVSAIGLLLAVWKGSQTGWGEFLNHLEAAALGFAGFFAIAWLGTLLLRKDAMGGGDIKLAFLIGVFLGINKMLAGFFLAFLIGVMVTLPMLAARKKGSKDMVPFGPMLATGAMIAFVKGAEIVEWYGNMMMTMWMG